MERTTTRLGFFLIMAAALFTAASTFNAHAFYQSYSNDRHFEILGLDEGEIVSGGLAVEVQAAHAIRWVEFRVGDYERIERYGPYSLASDQRGRLLELDTERFLRDGDQTLEATVHWTNGRVSQRSVNFKVQNDPWPGEAPDAPADAEFQIVGLKPGQTVRGDLVVEVTSFKAIRQVDFAVGDYQRSERYAPYSLASDHFGQLHPLDTEAELGNGLNTLHATVHWAEGGRTTRSINFVVANDLDDWTLSGSADIAAEGGLYVLEGPLTITRHGTHLENVKIVLPADADRFAPAVRIAANDVTLRNVEIEGPDNGRGWGVVFSRHAKRARLTEVQVSGFHDGVLLRGVAHRFERCVFTGMHHRDSGQAPATLVGTDVLDVVFRHCVFNDLSAGTHHAEQARHIVLSEPWKAKAGSDTQQHDHALGVQFEQCVVADGPSGAFAMGTGGNFTDGIIGPFSAHSFIAPPGGQITGNFVFFDGRQGGEWFDWRSGIGQTLGSALFDWLDQTRDDAGVFPHHTWQPQWVGVMVTIDRGLLDAVIQTLYTNLEAHADAGDLPTIDLGDQSQTPDDDDASDTDGNDDEDDEQADDSPIPADLRNKPATKFVAGKTWEGDHRFEDLRGNPWAGTWGNWCQGKAGRLYIDGGKLTGGDKHRGQPFRGWAAYYFRDVEFHSLQWATESNAGTKRGAIIDCDFYEVREDAIRDVAGHIENVTIHSADMIPGAHGDTIDWKSPVDGAVIKNLRSETGVLNGIITSDVKNLVIDGYVHRGGKDHLSIDIGGDAENVIIRNCKLSGGIRFRGKTKNVKIDWRTVQTNARDW
jgi:hypothetical protein